jgi:hypothetical protein
MHFAIRIPFNAVCGNSELISRDHVVPHASSQKEGGMPVGQSIVLIGGKRTRPMHGDPFARIDHQIFASLGRVCVRYWSIGTLRKFRIRSIVRMVKEYHRAHLRIGCGRMADIGEREIGGSPFARSYIIEARNRIPFPTACDDPSPNCRHLSVSAYSRCFSCAFSLDPQCDGSYRVDNHNDQRPKLIFFVKWLWVFALSACAIACAIRSSTRNSGFIWIPLAFIFAHLAAFCAGFYS